MLPEFENGVQGPQIEEQKQFPLVKYAIILIIALALVLVICGVNGLLTENKSPMETAKICCDAFFVAGAVILGLGALSWCKTKGAFDGIGFAVSSYLDLHRVNVKQRMTWQKKESFEEYVKRKHKKDGFKQYLPMLIVGALLIVVAVICLVVYHSY